MTPPDPASATPSPPVPLLPLDQLAMLLSSPPRWLLLQELAKGEALPVSVLGERIGITADLAGKHLKVLRSMGVVTVGYGRLYSLSPAFRPAPGTRTLDFGICQVRLEGRLR
jgi:DNA-binding transcriptional ArsR family regulator